MNVNTVFSKNDPAYVRGNGIVISNADIAERGKKGRTDQRDVLDISANSRFTQYSGYDGYADLKEFGESLRYRYSHTVGHSSTWFYEAAGEILEQVKEEKGNYDGTDIVNAYGLAYARLYDEMEKRYEDSGEQWFDIDGTPLTKEKEMEYLDKFYEEAVAFRVSSAKVMAGLRQLSGQTQEAPQKDMEAPERAFYRSRDKYLDLYKACRITGEPLVLQRFSFGHNALLALLV